MTGQKQQCLPDSWVLASLGELGTWMGGGTPSKSEPRYWDDGTTPWISPKDMKIGRISDTKDHITHVAVAESNVKPLASGSVVVVTRSGILQRTLPVAVTAVETTMNQDLKGMTPHIGVDSLYVCYALRRYEQAILQTCSKNGTTVASIEFPRLLAFTLPVAPLAEQRRIVAAIEEQFSRLDAAVASLERARANLKRYRAAVLQAAVSGRLTSPYRECGGDALDQQPPSDSALPPLDEISGAYHIPDGWYWTDLASIADIKGGVTKGQRRKADETLQSVPYLRVANVQRGFLDLSDLRYIEASEQEVAALKLEPGDILFNEGGDRDKLGRGWVWEGHVPLCIHQNHVFRARLRAQDIQPKFVSWYGNTFGQRYFNEQGKQTTNLASLNLSKLSKLPVPIPPPAEQRRIVAEVERLLSVVEELETSIHHNLKRAERLRQAILKRAFAGELVPQDPSDEPASVLLERIRAERAKIGDERKSRRSGELRRGWAPGQGNHVGLPLPAMIADTGDIGLGADSSDG